MGWVLIGLGVVLMLAGAAAVVGLLQYSALERERAVIGQRWDSLLAELDRRQSLILPLARLVASRVPQAGPALENLLALRDEAASLRRLDQAARRADGEERLEAGLRQMEAAVGHLPGLALDPHYRASTSQLDVSRRQIREAVTAFNLAVDSHRQRVSRGLPQRVARLAHVGNLSRFESQSRRATPPGPRSGERAVHPDATRPEPVAAGLRPVRPPARPVGPDPLSPARRAVGGPWPGQPPAVASRPAPADDSRDTRPTFISSFDPSLLGPRSVAAARSGTALTTPRLPSPPPAVDQAWQPAATLASLAAPTEVPPTRPAAHGPGGGARSPASSTAEGPPARRASGAPVGPTGQTTAPPAPAQPPAAPAVAPLGVLDFLRSGASGHRPPGPP